MNACADTGFVVSRRFWICQIRVMCNHTHDKQPRNHQALEKERLATNPLRIHRPHRAGSGVRGFASQRHLLQNGCSACASLFGTVESKAKDTFLHKCDFVLFLLHINNILGQPVEEADFFDREEDTQRIWFSKLVQGTQAALSKECPLATVRIRGARYLRRAPQACRHDQ